MKWLSFSALALATIGIIDTFYLSYSRFTNTALSCDAALGIDGCNVVATSPHSELFGLFPLAYIGLFFYILIAILIVLMMRNSTRELKKYLLIATGLGFVSSLYFLYVQAFEIGTFCIYCLISAAVATILHILAQVLYRN